MVLTQLQQALRSLHQRAVRLRNIEKRKFHKLNFTALHGCHVPSMIYIFLHHINTKSKYGYTPLYVAVKENNYQTVKILIDNKANIDEPDNYGITPLILSIYENLDNITELLV